MKHDDTAEDPVRKEMESKSKKEFTTNITKSPTKKPKQSENVGRFLIA